MRKMTFYCDRCGKEITELVHNLGIRFLDQNGYNIDETEWGGEFCKDCYEEIEGMVVFMVKNPTIHYAENGEPIKKKDAKKAAARKLDLDLGKVGALLRANWSIKEIAKEMNCSEQTMYNHKDEALSLVNNNQEVKS